MTLNLITPNARREHIRPEKGLAVTLQYLVKSNALTAIAESCLVSDASVGCIVKKKCNILWDWLLGNSCFKWPKGS